MGTQKSEKIVDANNTFLEDEFIAYDKTASTIQKLITKKIDFTFNSNQTCAKERLDKEAKLLKEFTELEERFKAFINSLNPSGYRNKVIIGKNGTMLSKSVILHTSWVDSPRVIIRKILVDLFDRDVLAKSTLTGRYLGSVNKVPLNRKIVADIVSFVAIWTGVEEHEIRGTIRSKCSDEAKLAKLRRSSW